MKKRIAIFCDGTWNKPDNAHQTSVERLAWAIPQIAADGAVQVPVYFEGVGAGRGGNFLSRLRDRYGGGAFGWGLGTRIKRAYQWLSEHYAPGDDIYIFGFSRGAYTARSLAGMIRASGIPENATAEEVERIFARYRDRDPRTAPATDESAAYRWRVSPRVHTGPEEADWRRRTGKPEGERLTIAYLGIWDTVGALGVPGVLGAVARPFNAKYLFHDARLSSMVRAGRHALATDERRLFYPPTLWQNLDTLNAGQAAEPYRQEWFPGDHGIVGGSGAAQGLSSYALAWVAEGARVAGLEFDITTMRDVAAARAFGGALSNKRRGRLLGKSRVAGQHAREVSTCGLHRLAFGGRDGARYDPATLRPMRDRLAPHLPRARDPAVP